MAVKFINQSNSSELSNTSNIAIYKQPSNISMMFYEKTVMKLGHVAVLHFRNLTDTDFGNYTLQLSNDQAAPSMPKKFFFINIKDDRLVFGIEKGFNGGHEQTFIVEYQPVGMADATWYIFMVSEDALEDPFTNGTYYLKIPKIPDGQYIFKIHAENKIGNSSSIEGVYVEIKTALPSPVVNFPVAAVAGGVVGGILVVIVIVVALIITRRTLKPKMNGFEKEMDSTDGYLITRTDLRLEDTNALALCPLCYHRICLLCPPNQNHYLKHFEYEFGRKRKPVTLNS
ncbi:hypothetical protein ACJMK2_027483 [Sinanodonta woodiana]|uniref:Uncharacterized protein n=1 Tax=Sinanodonta woodiana TaxID=1069815 RepID=A0ABD3XMR0_SINWO